MFLAFLVCRRVQLLIAFEVDDSRQHPGPARGRRIEQLLGLALKQEHGRSEGLVIEADLVLDPRIELRLLVGVRESLPGLRVDVLEDLHRALDGLLKLAQGAFDAVVGTVELEVEFDGEGGRVAVDEFAGALASAAMVAEEREGECVEDAGFAAAVGPGEHPELRPGEVNFLFVFVREEAGEFDALRDHTRSMLQVPRSKFPRSNLEPRTWNVEL